MQKAQKKIRHASTGKAYLKLSKAYYERERTIQEYKAQGAKTIGCMGSDVPEELLIAAGFLPVRISGDPQGKNQQADLYLEMAFDPVARSQFDRLLDGTYANLDHLVISNSTDVLVRLYFYLREIHRLEPQRAIPNFYFYDFLFMLTRTSNLYNRDRLRDLKDVLCRWQGRPITEDSLHKAIAVCNENRRLLNKFAGLRGPEISRVSGVEALEVIGASLFMPREEHSRALRDLLEEAQGWSALNGTRIFVSGAVHEQPDFYELVESCGAIVVGEDHDWGDRHFLRNVDPKVEPIAAIVDRYQLRLASPKKALVSQRVRAVIDGVKATGAQGVIFFIRQWDEAASWDFPEQHKALKAMGIPSLLLVNQKYPLNNTEELKADISQFLETSRAQKGGQ